MLPVVDLKQDTRCEVSDQASRQWLWLLLEAVYTIIGWLVSSLAVITFSGVAKKE